MIDSTALDAVTTIVTHADCADGMASALILSDALPDRRVVFVQHNAADYLALPAEPGMLFCDIVPPPARAAEFVEAGAIVLDHHRGVRDLVARFGERGVFADEAAEPGVSGAVLAFREVWAPLLGNLYLATAEYVREFATLAGIRDTWQQHDLRWSEACAQAAALRFWPAQTLLDAGLARLVEKLAIGPVLIEKDRERDTRSIAEAARFEVGPLRVLAFEGLQTSDIADRVEGDTDLVLGWHYQIEQGRPFMVVSCRSRGAFSCLDIAKRYGGGGHTRAAGFRVAVREGDGQPYAHLRALVEAHVEGKAAA